MRWLVLVTLAALFTAAACEEQSEEEQFAEVVVESIARIREQEAFPPPGYQLPPPDISQRRSRSRLRRAATRSGELLLEGLTMPRGMYATAPM